MLVFGRKSGESLMIGENLEVFVVKTRGGQCRIGIRAPCATRIRRKEVVERDAAMPTQLCNRCRANYSAVLVRCPRCGCPAFRAENKDHESSEAVVY